MAGVEEDPSSGLTTNLSIALGSLLVLFLFLSLGGYCFSLYEQISFFDGFYFCFITMTTIGYCPCESLIATTTDSTTGTAII